jgi:predicted DNA-binding transcriptional regulator YafY
MADCGQIPTDFRRNIKHMYYPTSRVLTVLEWLQARDGLSCAELARRLEVSPRSVRRYVEQLQSMGIPVESTRGRHGGYRLRPGFKLPPLSFNDDEALALALGLRAAKQIGLTTAAPATESALAKLERVFPAHLTHALRSLEETLILTAKAQPIPPTTQTVLTLGRVCLERRRVCFEYEAHCADPLSREVDVYGIAVHEGRWYAIGHCHLRDGVRMFRADRIQNIQTLETRFERPSDWDTPRQVLERLAMWAARWTVVAQVHLPLEKARRRVPQRWVVLEPDGDAVRVRFGVGSLEWAARALISLECRFTVLEPPELREVVRRVALEVLETH